MSIVACAILTAFWTWKALLAAFSLFPANNSDRLLIVCKPCEAISNLKSCISFASAFAFSSISFCLAAASLLSSIIWRFFALLSSISFNLNSSLKSTSSWSSAFSFSILSWRIFSYLASITFCCASSCSSNSSINLALSFLVSFVFFLASSRSFLNLSRFISSSFSMPSWRS